MATRKELEQALGNPNVRKMLDLIAALKPGASVPFRLLRQKAEFSTTIRIGKRPPLTRERE